MTTIAWDGSMLAADKRSGTALSLTVTKIKRTLDGNLIGSTGPASGCMELMAWYENGADPDKFPAIHRDPEKSSHLLVINKFGEINVFANGPYSYCIEDNYYAIGSGRDFAMAAMYLGKNAQEAVKVATALSAETGNGIDVLLLAEIPF